MLQIHRYPFGTTFYHLPAHIFTGECELNTQIGVAVLEYLETTLTDRYVVKFTNNFLQRRSI